MLRDGTPCCTPRSTQAASAAAPSRTREDRFIVALTLPMTSENGKTKCDSSRPGRPNHILRSEEHTSELQSRFDLVCRLLLEKKKDNIILVIVLILNHHRQQSLLTLSRLVITTYSSLLLS